MGWLMRWRMRRRERAAWREEREAERRAWVRPGYGDRVVVVAGFYQGQVGRVVEEWPLGDEYGGYGLLYRLELEGERPTRITVDWREFVREAA